MTPFAWVGGGGGGGGGGGVGGGGGCVPRPSNRARRCTCCLACAWTRKSPSYAEHGYPGAPDAGSPARRKGPATSKRKIRDGAAIPSPRPAGRVPPGMHHPACTTTARVPTRDPDRVISLRCARDHYARRSLPEIPAGFQSRPVRYTTDRARTFQAARAAGPRVESSDDRSGF